MEEDPLDLIKILLKKLEKLIMMLLKMILLKSKLVKILLIIINLKAKEKTTDAAYLHDAPEGPGALHNC